MSNGDDEPAEDAPDEGAADGEDSLPTDPDGFQQRLDGLQARLDAAETEADLDDVEAELSAVESALSEADLPEPDEDEDGLAEEIESTVEDLTEELEQQRGPYAEDVTALLGEVASTIRESRWTDDGAADVGTAVDAFLDSADGTLSATVDTDGDAADRLDDVAGTIADAGLDADDDADTIASLLEAAQTLEDDVEAAESWEDLTIRERMTEEGFFDILESERRKDYPPEWNAVKLYEKRYKHEQDEESIEYILMAMDNLESDFMEENILDSLKRIGPPEAFDAVLPLAEKRNKLAIEVLGKIGKDEAVEPLVDFIDGEGDAALQITTLRALGAIGSEEATQAVGNRLAAENEDVRSAAARSLGRIGDTRAVDPLSDVLGDTEEVDSVRASAAWALRQIGTERALQAVRDNADDASYLVEAEAEKVTQSS
ncbi:HEAT repeat domain-containing protein [Halapricum sp. CBA1109]|uniref:HEAT repeat domain-containing protein n=1 Tax=Halapricum sp. CBA1109 TaxID=2668068 RepID=UPI0012F9AB6C|nr:HEAT repeat domain-containing protein [Halapricum sp. CBA1109]MUV90969.1 HEAT repeat domain-containing protein [Halapricum sp. CBA1109]